MCPTSKRINHLACLYRIHGPFELVYDIELLRLRREDAKGIWLADANGKKLTMICLDDLPNVFHIRAQTTQTASVPLTTGKWYRVRCRLDPDGKLTA